MSEVIHLVIVDDHPLYREGVATSIQRDPTLNVIAQGETAEDAIRLCQQHQPDILLLDIGIPGNGLNALKEIHQQALPVKVIILTASDLEEDVMTSIKHNAMGYVVKGVRGKVLIDIIKTVARGQRYVDPDLAARLLANGYQEPHTQPAPFATLTEREREILRCIARGCNNREIAGQLHLSEKTIKHYVSSILRKLNARNRVEAALMAEKAGFSKSSQT